MDESQLDTWTAKGLSLEQIEQRLRPKIDLSNDRDDEVELHDGYANYSHAGFLGKDESFLELLQKDSETIESANLTHDQLATAIENLIQTANAEYKKKTEIIKARGRVIMSKLPLLKRRKSEHFEDINESKRVKKLLQENYAYGVQGIMSSRGQTCPWGCRVIGGYTGTIFLDDDLFGQYGDILIGLSLFGERKMDFKTLETSMDLLMEVKEKSEYAMITTILPHLIRDHYFFEGEGTGYRADPAFLMKALKLG